MSAASNPSAFYLHRNTLSAINELAVGLSLADMAAVFTRHLLTEGQQMAVSIIRTDASGIVTDTPLGHTAPRWAALSSAQQDALRAGQPWRASADAPAGDLTPALTAWLTEQQIRAVAVLPVLRAGDLAALFVIADAARTADDAFRVETLNAYMTVVGQIGILLYVRQIIDTSRESQRLSAQMVETNRIISVAEDYPTMAQALFLSLPANITLTGFLLLDDPILQRANPDLLHVAVLATRETATQPDLTDQVNLEAPELQRLYDRLMEGQLVIVRDVRDQAARLLPNVMHELESQGLYSVAVIGLRSGARLLGTIVFAAAEPFALDPVQAENLRTIAGQVAIAIENRNLLNQTGEALSFVAGQYEISSILYRAETPGEMFKALYRFLDGVYSEAMLALVDLDADGNATETMRVVAEITQGHFNDPGTDTGLALAGLVRIEETPPFLLNPDSSATLAEPPDTLTLPLVTRARRPIGLIRFRHHEPVKLDFNRRRALRSLADQLTVTLENRFLLQQTASALAETRTLYDLNRSLLLTQDNLEMLRTVRDLIAPQAVCLALVSLRHNYMTDRVEHYVVDSVLTDQTAQRVRFRLHETLDTGALRNYKDDWYRRGYEPLFMEDVAGWATPDPLLKYLTDQWITVGAMIITPVLDDELLSNLICVAFDKPQRFDEVTRRLFTSMRDQVAIVLQNQRLLRDVSNSASQLGNQVRVLQTLNQLAANLNTTQDDRLLLEDAAQALVSALRLDHAMLIMTNPDGISSTVVGEYPPGDLLDTQLDISDLFQQEVKRFRNPLHVPAIADNPNLSPLLRQRYAEIEIKTTTLIPLVDLRDQCIGLASLDSATAGRTLSNDNLNIARTITAQAVASYQNVMQLRRTQAQARQLQQLSEFSQSIQSRLDVPSILDTVATETPLILPFDHLEVLLYDAVTEQLYLAVEYDKAQGGRVPIDPTASASIGGYEAVPGRAIRLDGTTAERAWLSRSALYVRDIVRETNLRHTLRSEMRTALVELIFSRGVPLGLVEIAHRGALSYSETDVVIFKQVVNQIGIAIENAQAYMQSQRVARSKALVNEISTQLQRQADIDSILSVTVNELGRALGARRARIRLATPSELTPNDVSKGNTEK